MHVQHHAAASVHQVGQILLDEGGLCIGARQLQLRVALRTLHTAPTSAIGLTEQAGTVQTGFESSGIGVLAVEKHQGSFFIGSLGVRSFRSRHHSEPCTARPPPLCSVGYASVRTSPHCACIDSLLLRPIRLTSGVCLSAATAGSSSAAVGRGSACRLLPLKAAAQCSMKLLTVARSPSTWLAATGVCSRGTSMCRCKPVHSMRALAYA